MIALNNAFRNFLREVKFDLIEQLDSQKRNATGLLKNSLRVVANQRLEGELRGLGYMEFLVFGSQPSGVGRALVNKLIIWLKAKKIPLRNDKGQFITKNENNYKRSAFAIANHISSRGTAIKRGQKGVSIQDAITRNIDKLGQEVATEYFVDFTNGLKIGKNGSN